MFKSLLLKLLHFVKIGQGPKPYHFLILSFLSVPELLAPLFLNLRTERQPVVSMSPLSGQSTHPEVEDVVKPLEESKEGF